MNREEAIEWVLGNRSMTNIIPRDPNETWLVRIAEADAAMAERAYWTLKAWSENLVPVTPGGLKSDENAPPC